ncbi:NucA/NucB deoxyribonuclease domain-containing protein [Chitinophaga sp. CB10]|uniref:NucA/NucB deoxyribonuclease domain-containing protein n=1 Tax=Chitinophaga sp. CB10 TaxID=1891659 RepID=UPI0025C1A45C|nr:NucA/NucB deoxyribonuclease domain-containing protein [Chitinophaga sp. CB10]
MEKYNEPHTEKIYNHTMEAISMGHPIMLTYERNKVNKNTRRRDALSLYDKNKNNRRPTSTESLDEYPFPSTVEGGEKSHVVPFPKSEQQIQAGGLGGLVTANDLKTGIK